MAALVVLVEAVHVEFLGDFCEFVLLPLRQVQIGVLLLALILALQLLLARRPFFLLALLFPLLLQSRRRLRVLEVEPVLVVPLLYLNVEVVGPVFEVRRIRGNVVEVVRELGAALRFDVLLVSGDDLVGEEVVEFFGGLLQHDLLFVTDEFVVFHFLLLEVHGVEGFDWAHFFNRADFAHLVHIFEPAFVAHTPRYLYYSVCKSCENKQPVARLRYLRLEATVVMSKVGSNSRNPAEVVFASL